MFQFLKAIPNFITQIIAWFYKPFKKFIPFETFKYAACGGSNNVFDILLFFIFYNFVFNKQNLDLGFITISPHIAAFLFVFPITFSTGFLLNKYVTFTQSIIKGRAQLFRYALVVGGAITLNYLFLKLFVEVIGWYATFSKIATTLIVICYSYIMQKHFTFRTGKKALLKQTKKSDLQ